MTGAGRPGVSLLRVAALSVAESARMVADADFADPYVGLALRSVVGADVLVAAANKQRATETVTRYIARMGGRATPYGLFAGTALAHVRPIRDLRLADRRRHQVRTRVDVAALDQAVDQAVAARPVAQWSLRANPLARLEGPTIRFARPGDSSADVIAVQATPFIAQVLDRLGDDVRLGRDLIADLIAWRTELTAARLEPLLTQLVECGLLERFTGLLQPGVEPAERAIALLEASGATEEADALRVLATDATGVYAWHPTLDERWDHPWQCAAKVVESFAEVPAGQRFDHQLELAMEAAEIDQPTVDRLIDAVARVQRINGSTPYDQETTDPQWWAPELNLGRLRDRFRARYEDAEVPLLAAIDLESGVLQPARRQISTLAVQAGITSDGAETDARVSPGVLTAYRRFSWNSGPVDISDFPAADTLHSRALMAVLLDDYEGRYDAMLVGGMGRSPFAMITRFALGRPELEAALVDQLAAEAERPPGPEEDPHPIRAELVYAPGGRIGNVLVRPRLLADTIALTGAAGGTLSLDRLTLRLDRDQFQLRDTVSGRPVVIELNTAHNVDFAGLDPAYALLGRLASGGGTGWNWGGLTRLHHLPRVTCGRVIVAPEQWQLSADQVAEVRDAGDPGTALRQTLGLDGARRWLGVGDLDQILPIDLDSARSIRAALARVGTGGVRLVEMPQAEAPAVRSPQGGHVAEVLVGIGPALRPVGKPPAHDILYCPLKGAEWVYARFHCGQSSAEQVIVRAAAVAAELSVQQLINDWFFVRYADDGYHVRFRLRAVSPRDRPRVLTQVSELGSQLRTDGLVGRIVIDDYVPEVSRYGGAATLGLAERLFTASSAAAARFVAGAPAEATRTFQAVADVLAWTQAVHGPAPEPRIAFLQGCQNGLDLRFARSGNPHGKLFREHRQALDEYLSQHPTDPQVLAAVQALAAGVRGSVPDRLLPVLGSALHMHLNRLFAFDANRLEYLSYEWAIRKIRELTARSAGRQRSAAVG